MVEKTPGPHHALLPRRQGAAHHQAIAERLRCAPLSSPTRSSACLRKCPATGDACRRCCCGFSRKHTSILPHPTPRASLLRGVAPVQAPPGPPRLLDPRFLTPHITPSTTSAPISAGTPARAITQPPSADSLRRWSSGARNANPVPGIRMRPQESMIQPLESVIRTRNQ
jgi:hypothetical protein